jgi:membrane peptidoglycan carboxypeptidase
VALDKMTPWVWQAAVALEDRNFFENPGINVRGLLRAFASNLQGGAVQGGSSITQQLIKNVFIPPEERAQQSYARKIKEVILALEVTRRYPKERLLEWYLNYNFYGNLAYGVEAAAQVYFGKSARDLTWPKRPCSRRSRSSRRSTPSTTRRTPNGARV